MARRDVPECLEKSARSLVRAEVSLKLLRARVAVSIANVFGVPVAVRDDFWLRHSSTDCEPLASSRRPDEHFGLPSLAFDRPL